MLNLRLGKAPTETPQPQVSFLSQLCYFSTEKASWGGESHCNYLIRVYSYLGKLQESAGESVLACIKRGKLQLLALLDLLDEHRQRAREGRSWVLAAASPQEARGTAAAGVVVTGIRHRGGVGPRAEPGGRHSQSHDSSAFKDERCREGRPGQLVSAFTLSIIFAASEATGLRSPKRPVGNPGKIRRDFVDF